jgi:uncharacterized protein YndB with AHSA1/START domain
VTYDFEVSAEIPAPPEEVYAAWMSSEGHGAMTGAEAHVDPVLGGAHDAWDGYIHGVNLELDPPRRLVQSWRSANFTDDQADSMIEVTFEAAGTGTLVRVHHSGVPADQRGYEEGGWQRSYFDPMKAYFGSR